MCFPVYSWLENLFTALPFPLYKDVALEEFNVSNLIDLFLKLELAHESSVLLFYNGSKSLNQSSSGHNTVPGILSPVDTLSIYISVFFALQLFNSELLASVCPFVPWGLPEQSINCLPGVCTSGDPGVCGRLAVRPLPRVEDLRCLQERQVQATKGGMCGSSSVR